MDVHRLSIRHSSPFYLRSFVFRDSCYSHFLRSKDHGFDFLTGLVEPVFGVSELGKRLFACVCILLLLCYGYVGNANLHEVIVVHTLFDGPDTVELNEFKKERRLVWTAV